HAARSTSALASVSTYASTLFSLMCFFSFRLSRSPSSTLFPYTTLFRSVSPSTVSVVLVLPPPPKLPSRDTVAETTPGTVPIPERSEEHTSELQSPDHLVSRLLLEKKEKLNSNNCTMPTRLIDDTDSHQA